MKKICLLFGLCIATFATANEVYDIDINGSKSKLTISQDLDVANVIKYPDSLSGTIYLAKTLNYSNAFPNGINKQVCDNMGKELKKHPDYLRQNSIKATYVPNFNFIQQIMEWSKPGSGVTPISKIANPLLIDKWDMEIVYTDDSLSKIMNDTASGNEVKNIRSARGSQNISDIFLREPNVIGFLSSADLICDIYNNKAKISLKLSGSYDKYQEPVYGIKILTMSKEEFEQDESKTKGMVSYDLATDEFYWYTGEDVEQLKFNKKVSEPEKEFLKNDIKNMVEIRYDYLVKIFTNYIKPEDPNPVSIVYHGVSTFGSIVVNDGFNYGVW